MEDDDDETGEEPNTTTEAQTKEENKSSAKPLEKELDKSRDLCEKARDKEGGNLQQKETLSGFSVANNLLDRVTIDANLMDSVLDPSGGGTGVQPFSWGGSFGLGGLNPQKGGVGSGVSGVEAEDPANMRVMHSQKNSGRTHCDDENVAAIPTKPTVPRDTPVNAQQYPPSRVPAGGGHLENARATTGASSQSPSQGSHAKQQQCDIPNTGDHQKQRASHNPNHNHKPRCRPTVDVRDQGSASSSFHPQPNATATSRNSQPRSDATANESSHDYAEMDKVFSLGATGPVNMGLFLKANTATPTPPENSVNTGLLPSGASSLNAEFTAPGTGGVFADRDVHRKPTAKQGVYWSGENEQGRYPTAHAEPAHNGNELEFSTAVPGHEARHTVAGERKRIEDTVSESEGEEYEDASDHWETGSSVVSEKPDKHVTGRPRDISASRDESEDTEGSSSDSESSSGEAVGDNAEGYSMWDVPGTTRPADTSVPQVC